MVFWLIAIAMPLLAILGLIRHSEQNRTEQIKIANTEHMFSEMEELQRLCSVEAYFKNCVLTSEVVSGLPSRHSSMVVQSSFSPDILENLQRSFAAIKGFRLITVIAGRENYSDIKIFHNSQQFAEYPRPGQRAARTILRTIDERLKNGAVVKIPEVEQRMLRNFTDSVFGNYFNPLEIDEDFASGFTTRMQGITLHTARRIVYDADKKAAFAYLAIFTENATVFSEAGKAAQAARKNTTDNFCFVLKETKAFPFIYESADSSLHLLAPVSFASLNTGANAGANLLNQLLDQGLAKKKPARYPYLLLSSPPASSQLGKSYFYARFAIFILLCASLLALKHFQQHGMLKISMRGQMFVAVFLATILPATAFLVTAYRYNLQQKLLRERQLKQNMKTQLKLFELTIKSKDEAMSRQAQKLAEQLQHNITLPENELKRIIDTMLDSTFPGVMLFRNDGLSLEVIDPDSVPLRNNKAKLDFSRDVFFAAMIKFFDKQQLIKKSFRNKLETTSSGRRLKALANMFTSEDVENFCNYEGIAQTTKKDTTTLRFHNFKILPPGPPEERSAAVLFMAQDVRTVVDKILEDYRDNWSFFNHSDNEGLVRTILIGTYDLDATSLDFDKVWPANTVLNQQQKRVLAQVAQGRAEVSNIIQEDSGPATAMVARKIGVYPLIALSQCSMSTLASEINQTEMLLLLYFVYLLVILSVLASILDELFAAPIKKLLTATRLTGEGRQVELANCFNNDISQLTSEFNIMNKRLKERERLQRFISSEAVQTISQESRDLSNIGAKKASRSIVFIHIRDFGALCDKLDAGSLINLLNLFFPYIETKIKLSGGQIDKYIGDAVMAVFADENGEATSSIRACKAALAIKNDFSALSAQLIEQEFPQISIGTGIATGEVISGRIGSYAGRLDYTVIGDRVNLAARLESISHFDCNMHILVDCQTMLASEPIFCFANQGELKVKGKTAPVEVYELLAARGQQDE
ncbi:MAG: adenylate/guanylate cyclase domain-containing protein [Candidatus Riflebacteria bacterium]|nr:adenylate/guanylate cyclase domain-containing protein [Candidatus Riflebacteria bacterium]